MSEERAQYGESKTFETMVRFRQRGKFFVAEYLSGEGKGPPFLLAAIRVGMVRDTKGLDIWREAVMALFAVMLHNRLGVTLLNEREIDGNGEDTPS